jgi:hypothetical protein
MWEKEYGGLEILRTWEGKTTAVGFVCLLETRDTASEETWGLRRFLIKMKNDKDEALVCLRVR